MSRRGSNDWIKKDDKSKDHGLKKTIEKGIILGAVFVIVFALFLVPKYEIYQINGELLDEKKSKAMEYPEKMTEAKYLEEVEKIRVRLEECKKNMPESINSASLYKAIMDMAKEADIDMVTVNFGPVNTEIDEAMGVQIRKDFLETENKMIVGPDQRILAKSSIHLVCIGDEKSCIRFIQAVENQCPIIKVISMGIKGEDPKIKTMTLDLESYGTLVQATTESIK